MKYTYLLIFFNMNFILENSIKYCFKLEATYIFPNTEISENRVLKTKTRPPFLADNTDYTDFNKILQETEGIILKGSRFTLDSTYELSVNINIGIYSTRLVFILPLPQ